MAKKQTFNAAIPLGMTGVSLSGPSFAGGNDGSSATGYFQEFGELSTADAAIFYIDAVTLYGTGGTPSLVVSVEERMPGRDPFVTVDSAFITPGGYSSSAITTATGGTAAPVRLSLDPVNGIIHRVKFAVTGGAAQASTTTAGTQLTTSSTTLNVTVGTGISIGSLIQIGTVAQAVFPEIVLVTGGSGTAWTVSRAQFNTLANVSTAGWAVNVLQGFAVNIIGQSVHRS